MDKTAIRILRWSCAAALLELATARGPRSSSERKRGPRPRCARGADRSTGCCTTRPHGTGQNSIGYPETFNEPPWGTTSSEQFAVQVAKADTHRFTIYRSDFLPGTNLFSPIGASRFNIMFGRECQAGWARSRSSGPQSSPGLPKPGAKQSWEHSKEQVGRFWPDRVVIAPSPYPGAVGIEAINNFNNTVGRSQTAATVIRAAAGYDG